MNWRAIFRCLCPLTLLASTASLPAQDFLDQIDQSLSVGLADNQVRARISGLLDLEFYNFPQPPPGLIRSEGHNLFVPRLTLFLDGEIGSHVYFFAESRLDTGFDPSDGGGRFNADEYAVRFTPWSNGLFNLQFGKFATNVGSWVDRHGSWQDPFITAPLPYETPTRISDLVAPLYGSNYHSIAPSDKYLYLPIIWGPVYALGAAVSGHAGGFDYALELKNTALSARPESWSDYNFDHPAIDLHLGYQPSEAWHFGFSAAEGDYLRPDAQGLTAKADRGNYREILFAQDISYARGHFQFWFEIFETRFQVPDFGNSDILAYYLEAKYKITPQLFVALRWNQEFFRSDQSTGIGLSQPPNVSRVDLSLGYRFTAHTQLKLQYSLAHGDFLNSRLGNTFAAQFTVRF